MPEKAEICTGSTTTVPPMKNFESPDQTKELDITKLCQVFHIGYKKMRNMVKEHAGAKWILYNGNRIMIKREQFEKWLDNQSAI